MEPQVKYIELKSGYSGNGPAWIGLASFSRTGNTVYSNGKAFRKQAGISGNHYDIETGEEYWISGVKKDMTDRHSAGGGVILVDDRILEDYLKIVNMDVLDSRKYQIGQLKDNHSVTRFHDIENEKIETKQFDEFLRFENPENLSVEELKYVIADLEEEEQYARFNKSRRSMKARRILFEEELEKRILL